MSDMTKLLLHCCCGPCAIYPIQALGDEGYDVTGFFTNPNIHPYQEYAHRLSAYDDLSGHRGISVLDSDKYGLERFMAALRGMDGDEYKPTSASRCEACYRLRLEATAQACKREGFEAFSTTLLVSPYQHHDMIRELGDKIAEDYGLFFLYRDFRPGFRQGQRIARDLGLYMQKYCGCVFSEYGRFGGAG